MKTPSCRFQHTDSKILTDLLNDKRPITEDYELNPKINMHSYEHDKDFKLGLLHQEHLGRHVPNSIQLFPSRFQAQAKGREFSYI